MKALFIALAAMLLISPNTNAQSKTLDARTVIEAARTAMGTAGLQSIEYGGKGSFYATGQAYEPGGPWPRYTITKYHMAINYTAPAMKQDLTRIDDERPALGGGVGGYNPVTFQGGIRPAPGNMVESQLTDGHSEPGAARMWLTPHGFLKGAEENLTAATVSLAQDKKLVSFQAFGKYKVIGTLTADNLVESVETWVDVPYTGDTKIEGVYSDYRDFHGVKFPMHIVMREGGYPTLDLSVADVEPNTTQASEVHAATQGTGARDAQAAARPQATPLKIADGVWALTPKAEGSILVEFKDYVVMVEGPGSEAYTAMALAIWRRFSRIRTHSIPTCWRGCRERQ